MFGFNISLGKVQGFSGAAADSVYMGVPGQVIRYINPNISGAGNSFQDQTMEFVNCIYWLPGPCHLNNLVLRRVELHVPILLLHRQFVMVLL